MGNWFKRASRPESPKVDEPNGPLIAALLMKAGGFPFDAFVKLLSSERICGQRISVTKAKENIYSFSLDEGFGGFVEIPAPYPWSDLEGPCATARMWPDHTPVRSLEAHHANILITMMKDKMGPVDRRLLLTQIVGMAARYKGVMGVYWPEGALVHYPPVFSDMAKALTSAEAPPLMLWVDYRIFDNGDGTIGMFTTGMCPLGLMELEIPRIDMNSGDLLEWGMSLTQYQLQNGQVLKNGDTIGTIDPHEFHIRYRPSKFGHRRTIMAIEK